MTILPEAPGSHQGPLIYCCQGFWVLLVVGGFFMFNCNFCIVFVSSLVAPKNKGQQTAVLKTMLPCCLWFMVVVISSVATGPFHVFQADEIQTCFLLTFVKVWQWWRCVRQAFTLKKKGLRLRGPPCGILFNTKWGTWGECRFIDMKKLRSYIKERASAEIFHVLSASVQKVSSQNKRNAPRMGYVTGIWNLSREPTKTSFNPTPFGFCGIHDTSRLEKMDTPDPQVWGINIYPDQWEDTLHPEVSEVALEFLECFLFYPEASPERKGLEK